MLRLVKKEFLKQQISKATEKLLEMSRERSWNIISDNCRYIISQIDDKLNAQTSVEKRKFKKENNSRKAPEKLSGVVSQLEILYSDLYDINLYIYKSAKDLTIIDIQYYPKALYEQNSLHD